MNIIYKVYGSGGLGPQAIEARARTNKFVFPQKTVLVDWNIQNFKAIQLNSSASQKLRDLGFEFERYCSTRLDLEREGLWMVAKSELEFGEDWPYEVTLTRDGLRESDHVKIKLQSEWWQDFITELLADHMRTFEGIVFTPPKPDHYAKHNQKTYLTHRSEMKPGKPTLFAPMRTIAPVWWEAVCDIFWKLRRKTAKPIVFDCEGWGVPCWRYVKKIEPDNPDRFWEQLLAMVEASQGVILSSREPEQRRDDEGRYDVPNWFTDRVAGKAVNAVDLKELEEVFTDGHENND